LLCRHLVQAFQIGGAAEHYQYRSRGSVHKQHERLAVDEVDVGAPFAQRVVRWYRLNRNWRTQAFE
jgi:hypothetical protein